MSRTKITIVMLAAIGAIGLFCGCARWFQSSAHARSARHGELFAVTAEKTPFYHYGPQQGRGPDRELTRDTVVTVIRHSFGYSKVRLKDGEEGFVANEDIARAPERLIAQTNDDVDFSDLPPTPAVKLPSSDNSPEFEPTPLPQPLMPQ